MGGQEKERMGGKRGGEKTDIRREEQKGVEEGGKRGEKKD